MAATVVTTKGGTKYHYSPHCQALVTAQLLSDWDCWEDDCRGHRHPETHAIERMYAEEAAMEGKLPCLNCVPAFLHIFVMRDFGHRPINEYASGEAVRIVCARCVHWTRWTDVSLCVGRRIAWPCTSAIVLGIVPR